MHLRYTHQQQDHAFHWKPRQLSIANEVMDIIKVSVTAILLEQHNSLLYYFIFFMSFRYKVTSCWYFHFHFPWCLIMLNPISIFMLTTQFLRNAYLDTYKLDYLALCYRAIWIPYIFRCQLHVTNIVCKHFLLCSLSLKSIGDFLSYVQLLVWYNCMYMFCIFLIFFCAHIKTLLPIILSLDFFVEILFTLGLL